MVGTQKHFVLDKDKQSYTFRKTTAMKIEISNVKKSFGDNEVVNIDNLSIDNGELIGLVGNNGAGKTTLFRIILDLLKANDGKVEMTTADVESPQIINPALSEDWKTITGAYIDEGFLIEFLTPEEYFYFIGKVNNISKEEVDSKLEMFEKFMGDEILGKKKLIRSFSAGNKQKIGIISTLLHRPDLVILDEPFNFLDPTSQIMLKNLLVEYNKETNATIIVSSHNLSHTIDISSKIVLMEHGQIIKILQNNSAEARKELEDYFNVKESVSAEDESEKEITEQDEINQ